MNQETNIQNLAEITGIDIQAKLEKIKNISNEIDDIQEIVAVIKEFTASKD